MKEAAVQWLEDRGLDSELAVRMGWDSGIRKDGSVWLKIPYIRDGKVTNTQYRSLVGKEFRFETGSEVELWNVDVLRDETLLGHPLVITEGACDALAAMQCGFKRVIAVPGWSDKNVDHDKRYEPFKRNEDLIKRSPVIIAAVDGRQHRPQPAVCNRKLLRGVRRLLRHVARGLQGR